MPKHAFPPPVLLLSHKHMDSILGLAKFKNSRGVDILVTLLASNCSQFLFCPEFLRNWGMEESPENLSIQKVEFFHKVWHLRHITLYKLPKDFRICRYFLFCYGYHWQPHYMELSTQFEAFCIHLCHAVSRLTTKL